MPDAHARLPRPVAQRWYNLLGSRATRKQVASVCGLELEHHALYHWLRDHAVRGCRPGCVTASTLHHYVITMSSCEAELVALCDTAIELLHIIEVVNFLGHETPDAIEASTDSKAAYDLCHRFTSAQNSRHVDRKMFKMRELRGAKRVTVRHIPGETNPADLFTKILTKQPFEKHRKFVLNLPGDTGVEHARRSRIASVSASSLREGISAV